MLVKLNEHFKAFLGEISLNPTREDRIDSAFETWSGLLKNDVEIKDIFKSFYLQGSYASKTSIRPQGNNEEFDVDAVLLVDLSDDLTPKDALNWLAERMKSNEKYKDKIKSRDRCVRVNYSGDFHMDVVLAKPSDEEYIYIPSKKEGEWVKTNPAGFVTWCSTVNSQNSQKFTDITKILKYWRDLKVGKATSPKSILLTTLIGKSMSGHASVAESLVTTLKNILSDIDSYIQEDDTVLVENPSLTDENLARDWTKENLTTFKTKLNKLKNDCEDALNESDKQKSIEKWQAIFGSKFPSELNEAASMASRIDEGVILVNSAGVLNSAGGIAIPQHRFFGRDPLTENKE